MSRFKKYNSAPLPFVGQKRRFASDFADIVARYPNDSVFVDLFGGSGFLSHITKHVHPDARVVYNDFDNFRRRIDNIPRTNALLDRIRPIADRFPRAGIISGDARREIFDIINDELTTNGYVDFITVSSSILFSSKYKLSVDEMRREALYNNVRRSPFPDAIGYLDGLDIVSLDYRLLFNKFKDNPKAVFIVDPPYLSTDCSTYRMAWSLADYLDVLSVLHGHNFIYFTSDRSNIVELCQWLGRNPGLGNPFEHCRQVNRNVTLNHKAAYTDTMLYTPPTP